MRIEKNTIIIGVTTVVVLGLFMGMGVFLADKNNATKPIVNNIIKKSPIDSVKDQFVTTVNKFDNTLQTAISNKDSALQIKEQDLLEYYTLKNEIAALLKDSTNIVDMDLAKKKIVILEYKIEELKTRNTNIEEDNKRLNAIIAQLIQKDKTSSTVVSAKPTEATIVASKSSTIITPTNTIQVSNLNFTAVSNKNNETTTAEQVNKFSGTFLLNSNTTISNAEVMVVVQQPDGKVVKNSDWESGLFQTKEGYRKIYSLILRFDYNKGTNKQCNFLINAEDLPSGKYTLQLYYKGNLIGQTTKTLS